MIETRVDSDLGGGLPLGYLATWTRSGGNCMSPSVVPTSTAWFIACDWYLHIRKVMHQAFCIWTPSNQWLLITQFRDLVANVRIRPPVMTRKNAWSNWYQCYDGLQYIRFYMHVEWIKVGRWLNSVVAEIIRLEVVDPGWSGSDNCFRTTMSPIHEHHGPQHSLL